MFEKNIRCVCKINVYDLIPGLFHTRIWGLLAILLAPGDLEPTGYDLLSKKMSPQKSKRQRISFLWLLWRITTNWVAWSNKNLLSHSSGWRKSKIKELIGLLSLKFPREFQSLPLPASGGSRSSLVYDHITPVSSSSASLCLHYLFFCPQTLSASNLSR